MSTTGLDPTAPRPVATLPALAEIDLAAVRSNVAELDRIAGGAAVMAVVKADAYGHGLVPCAQAALAGGATWLGVAQLDEGSGAAPGGRRWPPAVLAARAG